MGKSVVVTAKAIQALEKQLAAHDRAITREQERRAETAKKLDAMRTLLGMEVRGAKATAAIATDEAMAVAIRKAALAAQEKIARNALVHARGLGALLDQPALPQVTETEVSVPEAVIGALAKRGPLTAVQIRDAVTEAGVKREKLGATYSYLYTVLGRLEQRRRILKVRGKYQLPVPENIVIEPKTGELRVVGTAAVN